jgi:hypothetical protein
MIRPVLSVYSEINLSSCERAEIVWDDETQESDSFQLLVQIKVVTNTKVFEERDPAFALYTQRLRSRISKRLKDFRFSSARLASATHVKVSRGSIFITIVVALIWTYEARRKNFVLMVNDVENLINLIASVLKREERKARVGALKQAPARVPKKLEAAKRIEKKKSQAVLATTQPVRKPVKLEVIHQGQKGPGK